MSKGVNKLSPVDPTDELITSFNQLVDVVNAMIVNHKELKFMDKNWCSACDTQWPCQVIEAVRDAKPKGLAVTEEVIEISQDSV